MSVPTLLQSAICSKMSRENSASCRLWYSKSNERLIRLTGSLGLNLETALKPTLRSSHWAGPGCVDLLSFLLVLGPGEVLEVHWGFIWVPGRFGLSWPLCSEDNLKLREVSQRL